MPLWEIPGKVEENSGNLTRTGEWQRCLRLSVLYLETMDGRSQLKSTSVWIRSYAYKCHTFVIIFNWFICTYFCYANVLTEQGTIPVPAACMSAYPAKISSRLSQWKRTTFHDFTVRGHNWLRFAFCVDNAALPLTVTFVMLQAYLKHWLQGSHASWKVLESPGFFFFKIPGPGKSWKITLVLESPGNWSLRSWKVLENCCHQMSYFKAKMHQIRFRRPRTGGAHNTPPRSPSWI